MFRNTSVFYHAKPKHQRIFNCLISLIRKDDWLINGCKFKGNSCFCNYSDLAQMSGDDISIDDVRGCFKYFEKNNYIESIDKVILSQDDCQVLLGSKTKKNTTFLFVSISKSIYLDVLSDVSALGSIVVGGGMNSHDGSHDKIIFEHYDVSCFLSGVKEFLKNYGCKQFSLTPTTKNYFNSHDTGKVPPLQSPYNVSNIVKILSYLSFYGFQKREKDKEEEKEKDFFSFSIEDKKKFELKMDHMSAKFVECPERLLEYLQSKFPKSDVVWQVKQRIPEHLASKNLIKADLLWIEKWLQKDSEMRKDSSESFSFCGGKPSLNGSLNGKSRHIDERPKFSDAEFDRQVLEKIALFKKTQDDWEEQKKKIKGVI